MGALPRPAREALERALVCEFTVLGPGGRPITHPMIPLFDGEKIFLHSSILFSKKLEHIKNDPRVSVSISDPVAAQVEPFRRATIQGTARIVEDDLHSGWERVLPLWAAKEPIVTDLVKKRFAMPLFWERAVIEIKPTRAFLWAGGDTSQPAKVFELQAAA